MADNLINGAGYALGQYRSLQEIAFDKSNGTICGHLLLPEVPKIMLIHQIHVQWLACCAISNMLLASCYFLYFFLKFIRKISENSVWVGRRGWQWHRTDYSMNTDFVGAEGLNSYINVKIQKYSTC